jgi:phosphonate transport system substrate-binding protein
MLTVLHRRRGWQVSGRVVAGILRATRCSCHRPTADGHPADRPTSITFGAVPAENASSLEANFVTTQTILEAELGLDDVEFFRATDFAGVIEGIIAGRVDVAQFGGFSNVIATSNGADISVASVQTDGPEVDPGYRSYALTQPVNDDITSIEDFAWSPGRADDRVLM